LNIPLLYKITNKPAHNSGFKEIGVLVVKQIFVLLIKIDGDMKLGASKSPTS
jgi:hypothetical protein